MSTPIKTTHNGIVDLINNICQAIAEIEQKRLQAARADLPASPDPLPETKWEYGLRRMLKRAQKIHKKFQQQQEDLNVDHALTDKATGKILRNERGGYEFDKPGLKALNAACRTLLDSGVEILPYYVAELPNDLSGTDRDTFMGFLIEGEREED
jgi:hypothetical protein